MLSGARGGRGACGRSARADSPVDDDEYESIDLTGSNTSFSPVCLLEPTGVDNVKPNFKIAVSLVPDAGAPELVADRCIELAPGVRLKEAD